MDYDNDGKLDILAGDTKGNVWIFTNVGTKAEPKLAKGVRVKAGGKPITAADKADKDSIIGTYSKLHFADWNGDDLRDILIGQNGKAGREIVFYKNIGTQTEPKFEKPVPIELPEHKMSRPSPYVIDWDGDGVPDLLCGTERAQVIFFKNKGTAKSPKLAKGSELKLEGADFDKSYRCRIDVTDYNNDGKLDLLVGNFYSYKKPMGGNIWLFLAE